MTATKRYAVYCRGELIGEYTFEVIGPEMRMKKPWPASDEWAVDWEETR